MFISNLLGALGHLTQPAVNHGNVLYVPTRKIVGLYLIL